MSQLFLDSSLLKWEAYASGGKHGYADRARIVFNCLSDRGRRARFIEVEGDQGDAQREVASATPERLVQLLERSEELD